MYQSIMTYSIITSGLISSTGEFRMIPAQQLQCKCTRKPDDRDKINHQEPYVTLEWLIYYILLRFNSRTRIFRSHRDITIASKGRKNLSLFSVFKAFEQGGIFIVPCPAITRTSVYSSHPKDHPVNPPLPTS